MTTLHRHRWMIPVAVLPVALLGVYLFPGRDAGKAVLTSPPPESRRPHLLRLEAQRLERAEQREEAVACLQRCLEMEQQQPSPDAVGVGLTLLRLGHLYRHTTRGEAARSAFEQALALAPAESWLARDAQAGLAALQESTPADEKALGEMRRAWARAEAGDFRTALHHAEQACREAVTPRTRSEAAWVLGTLGREREESYRQAGERLHQALTALQQTHGADHPLVARCLCAIAGLEEDRGQFFPAETHLREARELFRAAVGENSPEFADATRQLGRMYAVWSVGDASDLCLRALQIREHILGPEHPDCAESTIDLGILALQLYDDARAVRLLSASATRLQQHHGRDHPRVAEALSWLGMAHTRRCEYTQARVCHRQALQIVERTRGVNHLAFGRYTLPFAILLGDSERDYVRPRRMLERAIALREQLGCAEHPEQAHSLAMLAMFYADNTFGTHREPTRALECYDRAIALYERIPAGKLLPLYVRDLASAAGEAHFTQYQHRSLKECEELNARAESAMLAQLAGRDRSRHAYYRFIERAKNRFATARDDPEASLHHARAYYEAVTKRFGAENPEHIVDSISVLHSTQIRYRQFADAYPNIRIGLEAATRLAEHLGGQAERSRLAYVVPYYLTLSCALTVASELPPQSSVVSRDELYAWTVRFRGLVGARQSEDRLAFDHPEIEPKLSRVRTARADLVAHLLADPKTGPDRPRWLDTLARKTDAKEDLEAELAEACRPFAANRDLLAVTTADVQKALPPGTTLIDFVQYQHFLAPPPGRFRMLREQRLAAFILSREGPPTYVPLGTVAETRALVDAWRTCIFDIQQGVPADIHAAGQALARKVWHPLAAHLPNQGTVLIAPEGPLCFVPFAALPGRQAGQYLLHDYTVGYVPSGRWLIDHVRRRPGQPSQGLLSVGGIHYGGRAADLVASRALLAGEWGDLPGSVPEVKEVQRLFTQHRPNADEKVTVLEKQVRKPDLLHALAQRPRVFHFAGHGYFAGEEAARSLVPFGDGDGSEANSLTNLELQAFSRNQQLLSGLVLSGANSTGSLAERSAAVLTAEEVGSIDLRGTDLVVLSACETGLGNVAGNEGPLGLQRAFLNAGSETVVTSLWKVDDAATSTLMQEFYGNLWAKKLPRLEALRQAQLKVAQMPAAFVEQRGPRLQPAAVNPPPATTPPHAEGCGPVLWAAFTLSGNHR